MGIRTKLIASALVGGMALTAAIPAQAQSWSQSRDWQSDRYDRDDRDDRNRYGDRYDARGQANAINVQISQLEQRIRRTDNRDRISEREAAQLRRSVYELRQQYRAYSRNGLTQREASVLQQRIQQVRQRLTYERRDNDGRRW
ncbi:MAG: hypothetical protein ACK4NZ_03105 [Tsuneonella sp.]